MKKIEAKTLEEAYEKAAAEFNCSILDLEYEIVQHPSNGFFGFGAKKAVIVAVCKTKPEPSKPQEKSHNPSQKKPKTDTIKPKITPNDTLEPIQDSTIQLLDSIQKETDSPEDAILDGFFDKTEKSEDKETSQSKPASSEAKASASDAELGRDIEKRLNDLIGATCFDIDTVEVDVIDGTAYIFLDGEDAALLIGKEGYRYNALSYLLYNWLHNEFDLFIKLEIAQFLASQQEMIRNYIQPVIDHVYQNGWGKTRPLDGILVQIALEQLREEFPNKYVAIKRTKSGDRYVLINEFNKRS